MTSERYEKIGQLFHAALELPAESRGGVSERRLRRRCGPAHGSGIAARGPRQGRRFRDRPDRPSMLAAWLANEGRSRRLSAAGSAPTRSCRQSAVAGWAKSTWRRIRGSAARSRSSCSRPRSRAIPTLPADSSRKRAPHRRSTTRTSSPSTRSASFAIAASSRWSSWRDDPSPR